MSFLVQELDCTLCPGNRVSQPHGRYRPPSTIRYTWPVYESLAGFLKTFSSQSPMLWALLVMGVISLTGLILYGFWELVLRGISLTIYSGSRNGGDSPPGRGGH